MNHKRYTHYKPSNVDWLGDIPAHWEVRKLKYLTEFNPSKTLFLKTANLSKEVVFLPMEKVSEDGKIDNSIKKPIHEVANGYTFFEQGDVIYAKITPCFENGKGAYLNELETNQGFGSTEFTVLRPNLKFLSGAYLQYILQSKFFRKIGERFMEGAAGQKRVSTDFVKNFTIGIPSLIEQTAIVTYLNRKLADIDTFIAKKQRLITLLQEQKAAMINKAVTKGLNENEMRPSGIAWLGDIPTHWEVRKLKYVATFNPSKALALKGVDMNEEVVFLPMEKVSEDGKIDNSIKKPIHEVANGYTFFEKGDIIYAKITPCFENGKGAYLNKLETNKGFGSTEFTVLRPHLKFIHGAYLQYILQSKFFRKIGERFMEGAAGQKRVSTDFVKNFTIGVPSPTEQIAIVSHIEAESARIDKAIQLIERELTLVQEYRTALIAEAVTGKIDCTP